MGRITSTATATGEPMQNETTKTHFSHPHPLQLITLPHHQTLTLPLSCSGCNLKPSGTIYSCTTCNYFLHKKCFDMPKKISHPFHKDHSFTLLPAPAYDDGFFNCDACGEKGSDFSYHCKPCSVDLHILCASMPLSLTNGCHNHKLDLTFESPYGTEAFCCDICRKPGSNHWLYRCGLCEFDAHLNCARGPPPVTMAFQAAAVTSSRSVPQPQAQNYQGLRPHNVAAGVPVGGAMVNPFEVNRQSNEMLIQAIQQMINNNTALTQAVLAGGGGGGGGGGGFGGNAELQQLMRMMSGLNNSGIVGGGVDVLQSLMGGGGLDFLGGGFDFLGGALGGLGL